MNWREFLKLLLEVILEALDRGILKVHPEGKAAFRKMRDDIQADLEREPEIEFPKPK